MTVELLIGTLTQGLIYALVAVGVYITYTILDKTNAAGIPVYGSEVEQVKLGCVAAAGLDYVKLGVQTGQMAAKVLKGEAVCADIPYETISEYGCYINSDALAEMNITMPEITQLAGNGVAVIESSEA